MQRFDEHSFDGRDPDDDYNNKIDNYKNHENTRTKNRVKSLKLIVEISKKFTTISMCLIRVSHSADMKNGMRNWPSKTQERRL